MEGGVFGWIVFSVVKGIFVARTLEERVKDFGEVDLCILDLGEGFLEYIGFQVGIFWFGKDFLAHEKIKWDKGMVQKVINCAEGILVV